MALKYYKVGNKVDKLNLYAKADKPDAAVKMVEDLVGPIAPQQLRIVEVVRAAIPEGETILGEESAEEEE